jgi:hypothetical protein
MYICYSKFNVGRIAIYIYLIFCYPLLLLDIFHYNITGIQVLIFQLHKTCIHLRLITIHFR